MKKTAQVLVFFLLFPIISLAGDYYVNITNRTGYTIEYMYVSPGKAKSWQEDVLGDYDVLSDGGTVKVTLKGYSSPIFDIRLVDDEGDTYTFFDFDVEEYDLVVTPDDLD